MQSRTKRSPIKMIVPPPRGRASACRLSKGAHREVGSEITLTFVWPRIDLGMESDAPITARHKRLEGILDERQRRLHAAVEAKVLGHGESSGARRPVARG